MLKKYLTCKKRIEHSISTCREMVRFAPKFSLNKNHAKIAGLYHDLARDLDADKILKFAEKFEYKPDKYELEYKTLLHGAASCYLLKKEKIGNDKIYNAVLKHTIPEKKMTMMEKLLYVIDFAEPKRNYPEAKIAYDLLSKDLDHALFYVVKTVIGYLLDENNMIHPRSIELYDEMILKGGYHGKIDY
ncbi:MAG: HD domain-containing protein [Candidatus Mcinerneyibacterium aminivorans]|uniref:HD domain-containing protein n=1 Tax=Candidatus Mcinerneyibacterium aminivorans TaxID=2703815 RepID=A0A5D0MDV0_9BACT|nr:MAG: HD domain-containing protein [Candidatus Mcinerneyibacterium aminivorans]